PIGFATIQCGVGLATAAVLLLLSRFPDLVVRALAGSTTPAFINLVELAMSAGVLLPSALFLGATFPCAAAVWARRSERAGEDVGWLYGANTAGAIVGTVVTGFVLLPAIGVTASVKVGIVINLLLAVGLSIVSTGTRPTLRWGTLAIAIVAGCGVIFIDP